MIIKKMDSKQKEIRELETLVKSKLTPRQRDLIEKKEYIGISSPIEQNKRHIHLLGLFLKHHDILPKRMGISIRPKFKNFILVSPKAIIARPTEKKFNTHSVMRADVLRAKVDREVDKGMNPFADLATISKICSSSTLKETAKRLAGFHKPLKVDFRVKFGLPVQNDKVKGPETRLNAGGKMDGVKERVGW